MLTRRLVFAIAAGVLLRFAVSLHPVVWVAWIAPLPLLVLALRVPGKQASMLVLLAALIAQSVNFAYYRSVMPLLPALLATLGMSLLWVLVIGASRRFILRYRAWWTAFAYPVSWVAVDTLMAYLFPDGNWGSLAYTQADFLPVLQLTSLFGLAGVLFVMSLVPAALAVPIVFGRDVHQRWLPTVIAAVLVSTAFLFGVQRLSAPMAGTPTAFGLVAIDDAIGLRAADASIASIWAAYDEHVKSLAEQGAQVILLPEKIGIVAPGRAQQWQQHLSELAARNHVWIAAGIDIDDGAKKINLEWLFTPQGTLDASYQKHHLAPPERDNQPGTAYNTQIIAGRTYGLAICKDMHFAAMGRAYAQRGASAMLVPAWDFERDAWLAARMTATRGVESGFWVIRSSREGVLTVSDPYGRILAEQPSAPLPGTSLLVSASITPPVRTLYARTGDTLGWLCVICAAWMFRQGRQAARPSPAS